AADPARWCAADLRRRLTALASPRWPHRAGLTAAGFITAGFVAPGFVGCRRIHHGGFSLRDTVAQPGGNGAAALWSVGPAGRWEAGSGEMLLRVRVTLPDRPGALGQVARTLGVSGADIVQVVVLERRGGRAVDDFTVLWPGASRVERLLEGLAAVPGVRVDGLWSVGGAPVAGSLDAQLLAQVASNPAAGIGTLVDAVPALLAADWAVA